MHAYALALFTLESEKRYFILGQRYDWIKQFKNINLLQFSCKACCFELLWKLFAQNEAIM